MMPFLFSKNENRIEEISRDRLDFSKDQPRKIFSDKALSELASSIKQHGVISPILVRKNGERYTVIAGERRVRASAIAGLDTLPCIVTDRDLKECAEISLIENIQREDLTFFEQAEAYKRLAENYHLSQNEIAKLLSVKQSTVSNKIRLLKLPATAQVIITANGLTERHARQLLRLPNNSLLFEALDRIVAKNLNVAQTEEYISSLLSPPKTPPARFCKIGDMKIFLNTINKAVSLIKKAGIKPETQLCESDGFVEYIIKIPKTS